MKDGNTGVPVATAARRDGCLALLRELIALSRQGEAAVQRFLAQRLEALGCIVERLRYRPGEVAMVDEFAASGMIVGEEREIVVARLRGTGSGRSIILFAHPDSEPVADTARWRHDPFAGVVESGRIHGWGVADDLAGVALMVAALEALRDAGLAPAGDVVVAITPSKRHARGVAAVLHRGVVADAALYLHPAESGAGFAEIKAYSSGLLGFEIVVPGALPETSEPGHTIFAHRAVNPLDKAMVIHRALAELGEQRAQRVRHPRTEGAIGRSTNILVASLACGTGQIDRVASACTMAGSVSFPPTERINDVMSEVERTVLAAAASDAWLAAHGPRITWLSGVAGAEVAEDHPLFVTAAKAILSEYGRPPAFNPLHTASDIRVPMVQKGIPTIGLGPLGGDLTQNGRHDEWVDVEDYLKGVQVVARAIAMWCSEA